jgi:hypothetical protein
MLYLKTDVNVPTATASVADPGCLSRIQIPYPKTTTKERVEKKFVVIPFYVATNFTKLNIILVLKCWKKNLGQFSKNYRTFYPKKLSLSSQKYGFGIRDPRSGIR